MVVAPSRQRPFRVFYRLGFTPWDGHPLSTSLRDLVEGSNPARYYLFRRRG